MKAVDFVPDDFNEWLPYFSDAEDFDIDACVVELFFACDTPTDLRWVLWVWLCAVVRCAWAWEPCIIACGSGAKDRTVLCDVTERYDFEILFSEAFSGTTGWDADCDAEKSHFRSWWDLWQCRSLLDVWLRFCTDVVLVNTSAGPCRADSADFAASVWRFRARWCGFAVCLWRRREKESRSADGLTTTFEAWRGWTESPSGSEVLLLLDSRSYNWKFGKTLAVNHKCDIQTLKNYQLQCVLILFITTANKNKRFCYVQNYHRNELIFQKKAAGKMQWRHL